jgi:hypothetical protein
VERRSVANPRPKPTRHLKAVRAQGQRAETS